MSVQAQAYISPEEYLLHERQAKNKHEYFNGEIFAMAGTAEVHNTITVNVTAELHAQLKKRPCKVYSGDMRVKVARAFVKMHIADRCESNDMRAKVSPACLYTYPDVVVVCGTPEFDDDVLDTLLNPSVLIEVLSKFTENYDRGGKFAHYRKLASFKEYVLIAQKTVHLEHYVRQPDNRWLMTETDNPKSSIYLETIQCTLALEDVYAKVEFPGYPLTS